MNKIIKAATLIMWGGTIYFIIEVLWRGYSHPSMFIVGGLCFLLVGAINNFIPWSMSLTAQAVIGAAIITAVEFASGCVLNLWLGLDVWDYSNMPLNLLGQVCLPFVGIWLILAVICILLDDFLRWKIFEEDQPRYTWI